jgi:hypothetical protein
VTDLSGERVLVDDNIIGVKSKSAGPLEQQFHSCRRGTARWSEWRIFGGIKCAQYPGSIFEEFEVPAVDSRSCKEFPIAQFGKLRTASSISGKSLFFFFFSNSQQKFFLEISELLETRK